ncbi:MAG: hypothetical protein WBE26_12900, partial [Phycisphaerae bacterium]
MRRKDCENAKVTSVREGVRRPARTALIAVSFALVAGAPASNAWAGSVRLWPSAVIVDDTIRLSDLCKLTGFA